MHCFYCEANNVSEGQIIITGSDVNHIKNVLRMERGEELMVCDGTGMQYTCQIEEFPAGEVKLSVLKAEKASTELPVRLKLYQGLPKKDKMELIIQKAVELGAVEIIPVMTKRCIVKLEDEKKEAKKIERWQNIAESAAKQSGRGIIPTVSRVMNFREAVNQASKEGMSLIPYEMAEGMKTLKEAAEKASKQSVISVFIGPDMLKFYKTFDDIKDQKFDGMIVTGAPVELMPFEEVDYWDELCTIFDWAKTHVYSSFHICWGAQAALYYHYGIPKYRLNEKMFGVFPHKPLDMYHPLLRGFSDLFFVPHSRHTETKKEDIALVKDLQILSYSEISGVHLVADMDCRNFYCTGHSEYDSDTLAREYFRDLHKGLDIKIPYNYFPNDDTRLTPPLTWRGAGSLLFQNWLNYFVYQRTPYDVNEIK